MGGQTSRLSFWDRPLHAMTDAFATAGSVSSANHPPRQAPATCSPPKYRTRPRGHSSASCSSSWTPALQRARDALRQLEADGGPVTFDLVARTAGVSRAWLYTEPVIRDAIKRLRSAHRPTANSAVPASQRTSAPAHQRTSDASLLRRLEVAHSRNRELATEVRQLREQLARAHGQLRAARQTSTAPN
jgi:hypothetical protein